jgi:hypothetical protein
MPPKERIMGEAKRRKAADPNYGRPKRGLIITSPVEGSANGGRISGGLDPQDLRHSLLFWDRLVWPSNNYIYIKSGPDEEFLESAGILERPRYNFVDTKTGIEPMIDAQTKAFTERDAAEPGAWDLCQTSTALLANTAGLINDGGVQIELYRAIPVPDKDVPLNDILEFKRKRHNELIVLRNEIDGLIAGVNTAEDHQDELRKKLESVDRACADVVRISSEWQCPVRLTNWKVALDIRPFTNLAAGLGTYFATNKILGLTEVALTAAIGIGGVAASALKITSDFGWNGLKPRTSPYRYVAQFNRELF